MSGALSLLSEPWVQRFGWVLIHFIWQGVLIALLLAIVLCLFGQVSSHTRYIIIGGALVLCGVMPVVTWTILEFQSETIRPPVAFLAADTPKTGAPPEATNFNLRPDTAVGSMVIELPGWRDRLREAMDVALPYIVCLWFSGVLILTIRLTLCWRLMEQICLSGSPIQDQQCLSRFRHLMDRMAIGLPVQLLQSTLVEVPTLIGWLRPTILVPVSVFIGLTPAQLDAILAHELAHVRRYDYLVNLFQTALETILFYHPAVWWISRKLREERENCSDDIALEVIQNRLVYASALAQLEEGRAATLVLEATGGALLQRIRRIVGAKDHKVSGWPLWALIIGILAVFCLTQTKATETTAPTKPPSQTYVEVTYVETPEPSELGGVVNGGTAKLFIQNPKNKHTVLNDFALNPGMNTLQGKTPWGCNFTVTLNWSNTLADKAQDFGLNMEWLHANVDYGCEFKSKLRSDEVYVVTGPWISKEKSKLLISIVDHPSETPQKTNAASGLTEERYDELYNKLRIDNLKVQDMPLVQFVEKIRKELQAKDPQKQGLNFVLHIPPGEPPIHVSLDLTMYAGYGTNIELILDPLKARYPIRYKIDAVPGTVYIEQIPQDEIAFEKRARSTLVDIDFNHIDPVIALKTLQMASASKGFAFDLDVKTISELDALKPFPVIDLEARQVSVDQALRSLFYLADFHPVPLPHFTGYRIQPQSPDATQALTYLQVGTEFESFRMGTNEENQFRGNFQKYTPWFGAGLSGRAYWPDGTEDPPFTMTQEVHGRDLEQNITVDRKIIDKTHIQIAAVLEIKDSHGKSMSKVSGHAILVSGTRALITSLDLPGKGNDAGSRFAALMQVTLLNQDGQPLLPAPPPALEDIPSL